ncbi:hypothetical protein DH2020_009323 [Rehmannia glutinosa]|uniref:R2R3-MYB protein n=1 Tax=Rehmannia glutinosa TaxID=99300 RepID=A0ABR0X6L0_REHGL
MGRSPCCDKIGLKKGPWTPEEDQKLLAYIEEHGHGSWRALPAKAGLQRCGKSCRLRWTNYLRPDIKRGKFSLQEEQTIIQLHALLGNRWSAIATHLPKRTDNEIKNYWNTHLKKRLAKMGIDPVTHKPKNDALLSSDGQSKNAANLSHMAQWESARLEAEARLARQSKLRPGPSSSFQVYPQARGPGPVSRRAEGMERRRLDENKRSSRRRCQRRRFGCGDRRRSGIADVDAELRRGNRRELRRFRRFRSNSSGSCDGGILKEECEEDWKLQLAEYRDGIGNSIPLLHETATFPLANWESESMRGDAEHVPTGNFVEKFTDLLLSTSSGDRRFSDDGDGDGGESDNNSGSGGSGGGGDYFEDNKNYWNSILNLVNSSPSDSPMF